MCGCICILALCFALYDARLHRSTKSKARQVIVASATFDTAGRMLVKADGSIPFQVITTTIPLKDIMRELDIRESTFQVWPRRLAVLEQL